MSGQIVRHWKVTFHTMQPLPGFLRLRVVGSQSAFDSSYRVEGRLRPAEHQCTYQYTLSGEGIFRRGDTEYRVPVGSGFLCRIADPLIAYYYPRDAKEHWRFLWISFDGGNAADLADGLVAHHGPIFHVAASHEVIQEFLAFARAGDEQEISAARSAEMAVRLLTALAHSAAQDQGDIPSAELVRSASALVAKHLNEDINVSRLATRLGVSRGFLSRSFKNATGSTLHDYILRNKVLAACRMLKESSLSHATIAKRIGYDSSAHFSRVFRRVMQMTPRRFRASGTMPDL